MSSENMLARAESHGHFVQFYKADEPMLHRNVGRFLWEGLLRGDGLLVIATPARRQGLAAYLGRLGADVEIAIQEHQLVMLDAQETLDCLMVDGQPDWSRFQTVIAEALKLVQPREPGAGVCAYGEMVGVLWELGARGAAISLEECWNKLLEARRITLFCGYSIDVFAEDFEMSRVHDILCAHTKVLATGPNGDLRDAVQQAMGDVLGAKAQEVWVSLNASSPSVEGPTPSGEDAILWLRKNVPEDAQAILGRARQRFVASHAEECAG